MKQPALRARSLLTLASNGRLFVNFGGLGGTEVAERVREELAAQLASNLGLPIPDDYAAKYPGYTAAEWTPQGDELVGILRGLVERFGSTTP